MRAPPILCNKKPGVSRLSSVRQSPVVECPTCNSLVFLLALLEAEGCTKCRLQQSACWDRGGAHAQDRCHGAAESSPLQLPAPHHHHISQSCQLVTGSVSLHSFICPSNEPCGRVFQNSALGNKDREDLGGLLLPTITQLEMQEPGHQPRS